MILESVRYYVRCASFCNFRSREIVSIFKGVRGFIDRLTDKFSRPPRCDRFDIPAYIWCGSLHHYMQSYFEVARETRFTNPLRIPHEDASSSLVSSEWDILDRDIPAVQ